MIPAALVLLALAAQPEEPSPSPTPQATASTTPTGPAEPAPAEGPTPPEALRYPLGPPAVPDFLAPGDPFTLTDLRYSFSQPGVGSTTHDFAARVRYKDWGLLGAESTGEQRTLSLITHRLTVSAISERGAWELAEDFRLSRVVISADARYRGPDDRSWALEPSLSFRLTPDVELEGWAVADTSRPGGRLITNFGGDAFWQHGARLAAFAELVRTYGLIETGDENRTDTGTVHAVGQLGPAEITGQLSLADVSGRFPRRETEGSLQARVPLRPRLLVEGTAHDRFDNGSGELFHEYRSALTWFGRRVTLPRAGLAAQHAVALARQATRAGEYERSAFDEDALRLQRERLSLSPERESFRREMTEVYRAQVEERTLPLLGVEFRDTSDQLTGEEVQAARVFAGIPWPPALPWRARESSVPFLLLDYEHEWHTTATEYHSGADALSLTISLNREMDLVVRWRRAQGTALDIIRGIGERRRFEVSYVYARGR